MRGNAVILRGDARHVPMPDDSVDLIVTSPPYFALRSYEDEGRHYDGQVGSEPTPNEFLDALVECMREAVRVLRPSGSIFVNLGDKYAGSGSHNNATLGPARTGEFAGRSRDKGKNRTAPDKYNKASDGIRNKSLMGLPWRFAIRCLDELGLILRQELIWSKPNGIPESVRDRTRRSHEQWFHFVKERHYYAAIDELRTEHVRGWEAGNNGGRDGFDRGDHLNAGLDEAAPNPMGALPGSVWEIATEPLRIPEFAIEDDRGWRVFGRACVNKKQARAVRAALWDFAEQRHREGLECLRVFEPDHFAAFPTEWPRKLILGWSPPEVCTVCDEGRRPIIETTQEELSRKTAGRPVSSDLKEAKNTRGWNGDDYPITRSHVTVIGYACACTPFTKHAGSGKRHRNAGNNRGKDTGKKDAAPQLGGQERVGSWVEFHFDGWKPPPTRPAIVLDIFGGTGTTALLARMLGRVGISLDLSADYCRLARWRVFESGHGKKAIERTAKERQGALL